MIHHVIPAISDLNEDRILATLPVKMKAHPPHYSPILRHRMIPVQPAWSERTAVKFTGAFGGHHAAGRVDKPVPAVFKMIVAFRVSSIVIEDGPVTTP